MPLIIVCGAWLSETLKIFMKHKYELKALKMAAFTIFW